MRWKQRAWSLGTALGSAAVNYALWPAWPATVMLAVLVAHEWGHHGAARALGGTAAWPLFIPIVIGVIGLTRVQSPDEYRHLVYLAGPAAGLIAAAVMAAVALIIGASLSVVALAAGWEGYSLTFGSDGRKYRRARKERTWPSSYSSPAS